MSLSRLAFVFMFLDMIADVQRGRFTCSEYWLRRPMEASASESHGYLFVLHDSTPEVWEFPSKQLRQPQHSQLCILLYKVCPFIV